MVFSSLIFLYAFLPLSLAVYALCRSLRAKNISLLVFSLIFYAWGEPVYVLLLMAMALFDWYFALRVQRAQREEKNAKLWVALACVVNLGLIGFFKYAGMVCSIFGDVPAFVQRIALPLGISFYTFQLLSYVVDVYRGDAEAQEKYWHVLLYAALFHQCIAGPIVRYKTIAKELFDGRDETTDRARGCTRFAVGLAKKTVLANACGALADSLLLTDAAIGSASQLAENLALSNTPALALWIGIIAYAFQIYFDFSAYSDMAIGMGQMIGLHYLENFNYPYISRTATEFWRRWHMSLGTFFRDYVYIPRWQPEGKSARVSEPLHCLGAYRPLARGELELCALGALLLCSAHARPAVLAEAARQAAEGGLGDPFPHHAPARGALRVGALQVHIAPARRGGRARHVLRQRQHLYELHRYGGDKEPYVSAHLLRRGGNAGVFVSCEALGARRRGERTCAEKLFRCGLWRCAGSAAASEHRVPCRQQL